MAEISLETMRLTTTAALPNLFWAAAQLKKIQPYLYHPVMTELPLTRNLDNVNMTVDLANDVIWTNLFKNKTKSELIFELQAPQDQNYATWSLGSPISPIAVSITFSRREWVSRV